MDLRPVLVVILVLGGLDLVNIIRGLPAPANAGKVCDEQLKHNRQRIFS